MPGSGKLPANPTKGGSKALSRKIGTKALAAGIPPAADSTNENFTKKKKRQLLARHYHYRQLKKSKIIGRIWSCLFSNSAGWETEKSAEIQSACSGKKYCDRGEKRISRDCPRGKAAFYRGERAFVNEEGECCAPLIIRKSSKM